MQSQYASSAPMQNTCHPNGAPSSGETFFQDYVALMQRQNQISIQNQIQNQNQNQSQSQNQNQSHNQTQPPYSSPATSVNYPPMPPLPSSHPTQPRTAPVTVPTAHLYPQGLYANPVQAAQALQLRAHVEQMNRHRIQQANEQQRTANALAAWPSAFGAGNSAPAPAPVLAASAFPPASAPAPPIASAAPVSAIPSSLLSTLANPPMSPATSVNSSHSPDTDADPGARGGIRAARSPLDMTKRLLDETWATAVAAMQREADARRELAEARQAWEEERKKWEEERKGWEEEREGWGDEREVWIEERYELQQEKRRFERDGWGEAQKKWDEEKKRWQEERDGWSEEREEWEAQAEVFKEFRRKALNGKKEAEQAREKAEEARRKAEQERDDARDKYQVLFNAVQVERARGAIEAATRSIVATGIPASDRVPPPALFTTLPQNKDTTTTNSDSSPPSSASSMSSGFSVLALSPKQVGQQRVHEGEDEGRYLDGDEEYTEGDNAR